MERYFVFLLVHDSANQEDCQCHKNVIPALQSLVKDLLEFYNQEKTTPRDLKNSQYELFDPFLALEGSVPSIYFSILEDKLFLHQFEFYSKWCKGQHLEEVSRVLNKTMSCQNKQPDEMSSDKHADSMLAERLHGLADDLPDHVGVPVDVFWFMCGKNNMPVRSHLDLFGALKRLQQWHNANITVLCSNEFDRTTFLSSWQKALNISVTQLNTNDVASRLFNPSVIWQGSLVFNEDQSRIRLPSFNLCCSGQSKKNIQLLLKTCVQEKTSTEVGHSGLCIAPGIDVLCKVKKHTVPFHMFVPVKLNLSVACYSAKLSARLVEWLSSGNNKDIALIGSLKVVRRPSTQCLKEKNKEAWFNFVTAQNHSETMANSKAEDDDADSSRRLCLICGDTKKQLSLFVLRAPEHLNGRLQHDLAVVHSTLSISKDQEVGGPLRFPDLTDSFLETEQKLTEVLLSRLQQELSNSNEPCTINPTTEFVDQLISAKWKLLKEEREQLLRNGKEHELEVVRRETFLHATSDLSMSPSRWPERAWLIKNDPNTTVKSATAGDMTKQFPLVTSVSSLSVQDILEKFRLDGCPVTCDLSPVKLREQSLADRHIQINTTRSVEDVKGERYPEALAASYHGIEYCLDDRDAIAKDSQLAFLQSSHVKLETLSSCVQRDHKPVENRPARAVTKTAKNVDKKQHLMKLSVPLVRTKATGKGKTPAVIGRPLKRKSPVLKKPDTAVKRKREEPAVEETTSSRIKNATKKETRSERHKRRLRQVVQKALEDSGIDSNHEFYEPCTERLYSLCKSFLKDLRSSHGLNDEMKRLANSNVQQVIEFETKRT